MSMESMMSTEPMHTMSMHDTMHTMSMHDNKSMAAKVNSSSAFCDTTVATAMSMKGFVSVFSAARAREPCLVFLIDSLLLDSPFKFFLGCCFAMWLGLLCEGLMFLQRRGAGSSLVRPQLARLLLHLMLVALGYLLMLLVMLYSVEVTISGIAGLCLGRYLFGDGGMVAQGKEKKNDTDAPEKRTPCCLD